MTEQYGDYKIEYREDANGKPRFIATKDGEQIATSQKLSDLKSRLDRVKNVTQTFNRFKVLAIESGRRFCRDDKPRIVEWEVTSAVNGSDVRAVNQENKERRVISLGNKRYGSPFFADTPKNREILQGVVALYVERAALDDKIEARTKLVSPAALPDGTVTEVE